MSRLRLDAHDWYDDEDDLLYGSDDPFYDPDLSGYIEGVGANAGESPHEFDSDTPAGTQLVRIYRDKDGNWPNPVLTPGGYVYVYADGVQAVEKELPPPAGTIYHQVYAIFHPAVAPSFGWVRWMSPLVHDGATLQKRRSLRRDLRMRGEPKFPGGDEAMYREVKDRYGPGMTLEFSPEYLHWHTKVYRPWKRKRYKETRWWKKTPEGKRWRADSRARFRQYRRSELKTKLRKARSKKRKGLFKKRRKKASVWWRKQRLKMAPKASKRVAARLRRQRQASLGAQAERRAASGLRYSSSHAGWRRGKYGAVVPLENDDGTWFVFGVLGILSGAWLIF